MAVVPAASTAASFLVHYTVDTSGLVKDVWILTPEEAASKPWPTRPQEAQAWRFDPDRAGLGQAVTRVASAKPKVFIKTFGCQMNEYDSDKMADVLHAAAGYEPTDRRRGSRPDPVQHLLGAREGAGEGVQRPRPRQAPEGTSGVLIGVGGCVASQEGAAIVERAPYVDLVFGPQTLHRLPEMLRAPAQRAAGRRSTSAFPRSRSSTTCRRRASRARPPSSRSWKAAPSTARYCVVPYTRGEEVSRPFDDVLAEVAGLADQGVREVTLLGQNVNAYRGAMGGTARSPTSRCCIEYVAEIPGHRAHPLHHQPSEGIHAAR